MNKNWLWIACLAAFAIGCSKNDETADAGTTTGTTTTTGSTTGSAAPTSSYASVQQIFTTSCVGCHGATAPKGGINLTNHEGVMKGGEGGAIVKAGDPEGSKLVDSLHGRNGAKPMPLKQPALPEDQIKVVEDWIKAGATAS